MADHHENTQPSNVQQIVQDDHQFSPTDIPLGVRINIEDLNDHESNERGIKSAPSVDNENEKRVSDTINDSSIHARSDSDDYSFEGLSHRRKAFDLAKMSEMQKKLYYFFEEPVGIPAKCFQFLSYFLILYSTIEVAAETLPEFTSPDGSSFLPTLPGIFAMECFIFIVWSVELLGRIYASTNRILFWSDILNWVDLVAILPFFFSLFQITDPFLQNLARILRLTRVTKAVKLARYSEGVRLGSRALARSMDAIWMLLFFLFLSVLFSSSIMFWVERGTWNAAERKWIRVDGTPSPFSSIPVGFYWSMVTLATVGYGDVVPITPLGKFVASLTMILSIMIIALPTSIIGSNFIAEWQIYQQQVLQKKMRNFKLQAQKGSEETSELDIVSRRDRYRLVTEQNIIMVQAIGEIQEKLNDLNPPQYYQLYKVHKTKCRMLQLKLEDSEKETQKWKMKFSELKKRHRSSIDFVDQSRDHLNFDGFDAQSHETHVLAPSSAISNFQRTSKNIYNGAKKIISHIRPHGHDDLDESMSHHSKDHKMARFLTLDPELLDHSPNIGTERADSQEVTNNSENIDQVENLDDI